MRTKRKTKNLARCLYALFKFQPIIFSAVVLSLGYGCVTMITGSIKLSYFIGVTGACALIFGASKFYALTRYALVARRDNGTEGELARRDNGAEGELTCRDKADKSELDARQNYTAKGKRAGNAQSACGDVENAACAEGSETDSIINTENAAAKNIAISASVMSFLHFGIAVVCTFFQEESPSNYGLWFIFFVAGAAFVKIVLSTINAVRTRKNHNIIIHNIKLVDNANALIFLGLTQRAIVYYVGNEAARWASGLGGIFFSLCALFVCLTMFWGLKRNSKK